MTKWSVPCILAMASSGRAFISHNLAHCKSGVNHHGAADVSATAGTTLGRRSTAMYYQKSWEELAEEWKIINRGGSVTDMRPPPAVPATPPQAPEPSAQQAVVVPPEPAVATPPPPEAVKEIPIEPQTDAKTVVKQTLPPKAAAKPEAKKGAAVKGAAAKISSTKKAPAKKVQGKAPPTVKNASVIKARRLLVSSETGSKKSGIGGVVLSLAVSAAMVASLPYVQPVVEAELGERLTESFLSKFSDWEKTFGQVDTTRVVDKVSATAVAPFRKLQAKTSADTLKSLKSVVIPEKPQTVPKKVDAMKPGPVLPTSPLTTAPEI